MIGPLITVIIPIYGVEKYLEKCVDSVLSQTYHNIEILLVDDGSPDRCGEIIDEYEKKDSRIVALHKENGGLSDARNYATPLAKGDFITYIDSDDWVTPTYIENLYAAISKDNADMAFSWFKMVYEGTEEGSTYSSVLNGYVLLNAQECLKRLFYQQGVETSAWGKLYRKNLFKLLEYPKGKLYEDILVTYATIINSKKIAIVKNEDYLYFQRKTSIQNESFNIRKLDAIEHMSIMVRDVESKFASLTKAAHCRYFSCLCNIIFQITDSSHDDVKGKLWDEIVKYRCEVLKDTEAGKKARLAAFMSFFGINIMRRIYKIAKK